MVVKRSQTNGDEVEAEDIGAENEIPTGTTEFDPKHGNSTAADSMPMHFPELKSKRFRYPEPPSVDLLAVAELPTVVVQPKRKDSDTRRSSVIMAAKWYDWNLELINMFSLLLIPVCTKLMGL